MLPNQHTWNSHRLNKPMHLNHKDPTERELPKNDTSAGEDERLCKSAARE